MFIKKIDKGKIGGKKYTYYRLCESIRIADKTRHNNLLNLGTLGDLEEDERKALANRIEELYLGTTSLFFQTSAKVETLAVRFYQELREKHKIDKDKHTDTRVSISSQKDVKHQITTDLELVDINSIEHDQVRELGAEWLCLQAIQELGIASFLASQNMEQETINKALALLVSRAVYPASEHKTSQWMESSSAITELVFKEHKSISHQQLYKVGDELYEQREALGNHLSDTTNELFNLTDEIVFYDLTNTYFEGRKVVSILGQFGRSKEKRSDAKLVSLALVVNAEGFVKYSKIYEGNIYEAHTLLDTIEALSTHKNATKPLVVIDAGISDEDNLTMLKEKGYDYLCVTKTKLKEYKVLDAQADPIEITDNRNNKIHLQKIEKPGCTDQYMYIRSDKKAVKEASMEAHYSKRFEEELDNLAKAIHSKGGTKTITKVHERLGRIKERYPTANKHYKVVVVEDQKNKIATLITYSRNPLPKPKETQGVYFVRTSVKENDEKTMWTIYNTLTEVEATFRTLKTDLNLRPVHHQNDNRTEAHIHLGVLAYMVVNTIRYKLKQKGIHHDWSNIVRIMNTQKIVTTSMKNSLDQLIIIKKCSQPNSQVTEIYQATKYKSMPFNLKKYVVPQ
jgi:transposase